MKTIEDYFTSVRQLMQRVPDASAERYEEQLLSVHRGNLRIRLRFSNHALLEISEAIVIIAEELRWLSYRYHYQDPTIGLVFRYDNTPHHPEVSTHPHHKHAGEYVLASSHPSIEQVLHEAQAFRGRVGGQGG
jgi:hypothetical protein